MCYFDPFDNDNEYGPGADDESTVNYNMRRDIESGMNRREIMRKYGVTSDYVDAMDIRHLLDDEEESRW